ncbi:DJ-1/PfpI family protein [Amycolatopsis rhabdoformis]|uniref:DJ-1/PfpI family protein n=1 Tax=Amycolatopsis rhabdoformis TaxID=1448059 RepID=A0ABZ1ICE3_9PSEU|nr:DJ-1/PfpI family protein [Amycolatopsis rhabdoformis]WSE32115.1 DJ-1/PfpI family protein [Amycolatopsis rhabdoformis]
MSETVPVADIRVAVPTNEPRKGRIAILTADKVEDLEFFYPYYRFVEAGYDVDVITPSGGALTGAAGLGIQQTLAVADVAASDYLLLYVPGGYAPVELNDSPAAVDFLRTFIASDRPIGLICHGPQVLVSAGLATGRRLAAWYGVRPEIEAAGGTWIDEPVVQDGNIFTARKPGDLPVEIHRILEHLRHLEQQPA